MGRKSPAFPIVVSGPSGVGKTTLCNRLLEADGSLRESISATTRAPREGEVDGEDYFFVSHDRFAEMKNGALAEWAEVYGEFYGTPKAFVEETLARGHDVLLNIDTQGGISVKRVFPEAYLIFILPPSFAILGERIRNRGSANDIERRVSSARREAADAITYGYDRIIVNDDLDEATAKLISVIAAEREARSNQSNDRS